MAREVTTRKSESPQSVLPLHSLPPSVEFAIADPVAREVTNESGERVMVPVAWEPPTHKILPELLDDARECIERKLVPAGEKRAAESLYPLLLTQIMPGTEGMSPENVQQFASAKIPEYARLLARYPGDLLTAACDAHATSGSKFFPAVYELTSRCDPEFAKRQRQADRIKAIADAASRPEKAKAEPFVQESEEEKLKGDVARFHKFKGGSMHERLLTRAIASEQRLAVIESREPNLAQFGPLEEPKAEPIIERPKAPAAQAKEWKRPEPPIIQPPPTEEPPMPDEIPE